ncbi:MAG: hypothetical protein A2030_03740 [Chloroflexi bacterium RBG_19FT_COMBO_50_10]|nr:MAG: hypothetical protein A2030_03740 [Chloroflexi bacterium RBG_19FT_COMBO_50_10]
MRPVGVTADRSASVLTVQWDDAHVSAYPFSLLRHACPCAECRGGHEKMSATPDPDVFYLAEEDTPATHMVNIEAVGAYALTIHWEDGHTFGIYNWNYLRALCPCAECRAGDDYVG